ncbi:MAG: trypsin-like peptidase domain-containing protein [bacterium]|nr:trypsin-like peptidase domain-containing protein [Acidimicrobiia bacterium]MCY4650143.1 trypsin-like peptidase domain-containing protein [bacterium]
MRQTPPSEDPPNAPSSEAVEGLAEDSNTHSDPGEAPAGEEGGAANQEAEAAAVTDSSETEESSPREDLSDEGSEPIEEADPEPPAGSQDVSLFVSAAGGDPKAGKKTDALQGMGWKMMAVAGIVLLAAGFAAGVFFPDTPSPVDVTVTTTVTTSPAADPTTTSAVPTTTAAAVAAESPTTLAPSTTTTTIEPVVVLPPDLLVTDEPVSDVADRLVPSVVHLEIQSENVFEEGAGSGVIFDSNGFILTAAHVVETVVNGAAELTVRLSNGDRLPGEVVGTDPDSDVAVVLVDRTGLIPAELALEDQPRVGQLVVAVGSPWGLESSVTSGVISAVDRIVEGRLLHQSDAVLYPGNSGGALADRYGRLIGINVSIFTDSTTLEQVEFQGVGFAVPIDVAHRVAQSLIAGEPVHTAFLGVSGRDTLGDAGVEIMEVFPGSGAEMAGLQVGDVVVAVGGRPVTGISDLAARIRHLAPGDVIVLDVLRGDDELVLAATLLSRSDVLPDESDGQSPQEESEDEDP